MFYNEISKWADEWDAVGTIWFKMGRLESMVHQLINIEWSDNTLTYGDFEIVQVEIIELKVQSLDSKIARANIYKDKQYHKIKAKGILGIEKSLLLSRLQLEGKTL